MGFPGKQISNQNKRIHQLLAFLVLSSCFLMIRAAEEVPKYYFGGFFQPDDDCTGAQFSYCQDVLCPDSRPLPRCDTTGDKLMCYCHEPPADMTACTFAKKLNPDDEVEPKFDDLTLEESCLLTLAFNDLRSPVSLFVCEEKKTCVFQDDLSNTQITTSFGGYKDFISCRKTPEDVCKKHCPSTYAGCFLLGSTTVCQCHDTPPIPLTDETCKTIGTATPDGEDRPITNLVQAKDKCFNAAIGYKQDIDVYFCASSGIGQAFGRCVFVDRPSELPSTTTSTTTEETTTMDNGGFSFGSSGSSIAGCSICQTSGFFSIFVCPFLCLVLQIIKFVQQFLSKTLFKIVGNLFSTVTEILDGLLGALDLFN